MDAKQVLKDQAITAIQVEDYLTAEALLTALKTISNTVVVSPSPGVTDTTTVGGRTLEYKGPPAEDPEIPADEKPQATDFDLQRLAQMDDKDVRLHRR